MRQDLIQALQENIAEVKTVEFQIGSMVLPIAFSQKLELNKSISFINNLAKYQSEIATVELAYTLAVIEATTDLKLGETTEEKEELLMLLMASKVLDDIIENIPEELRMDLAHLVVNAEKMMREELAKEE